MAKKIVFSAQSEISEMLGHPGYVEMEPNEFCKFALKTAISFLYKNDPKRLRLEAELGRSEVEHEDGVINQSGRRERVYQAFSTIIDTLNTAHAEHASTINHDHIDHHDLQHGDAWLFDLEKAAHLFEDKIIIAGSNRVMIADGTANQREYPIPLVPVAI